MRTPLFFLNEDSKVLDALRNGDEDALAGLFFRNRSAITALVVQNRGDEDDAEDVLQEALVVLWERVRDGSFEYRAKLSTFLYAIAKNIWFRRLARQRREVEMPDEYDAPDCETLLPSEEMEENERVLAVQQSMERIGYPCRELLLLFYWEENSMDEIAQKLGFANADTVKSKKYQCKKALEKLVRQALGEQS
jgi:RNA polymerase sigma factor (sigma-70 family)